MFFKHNWISCNYDIQIYIHVFALLRIIKKLETLILSLISYLKENPIKRCKNPLLGKYCNNILPFVLL